MQKNTEYDYQYYNLEHLTEYKNNLFIIFIDDSLTFMISRHDRFNFHIEKTAPVVTDFA